MYSVRAVGETVCGSRQGTGGNRPGSSVRSTEAVLTSNSIDMLGSYGPALELELGVTELAHFGYVQAFELDLRAHPLSDDCVDREVDDKDHREDESNQSGHTHQLRYQLAGVTIEQSCDVSCDTIPRSAVVALAIGE